MGDCRFGHGRDDDDGRSDDEGHGRLLSTNMADAVQSACRQKRDTVHGYDLTFCGRRTCRHCVAEGKESVTLGSTSLR
jgi:hypothetical protein